MRSVGVAIRTSSPPHLLTSSPHSHRHNRTMNISFVGGGNMATALIGGLVAKGADARAFRVVEPFAAQQDKLVERFPGIGIFGEATAGAIAGADLVVIAVKPQQMREAAQALAAFVGDVPVVMTIAAGTRVA